MKEPQKTPLVSGRALDKLCKDLSAAGVELQCMEMHHHGACVLRHAVAPYRLTDKREMYSISKSFLSTAAGVAFDHGRLSPEDRLLRFFPEYEDRCLDERWHRLRLKHLLSMNTGHADCVMASMMAAPDSVEAFFRQPLAYEPGTHFTYNTGASCLMAEVVRRAMGMSVPQVLARYVFPALDIGDFSWETCRDGRCQGGTGLHVSASDLAKLGCLYLQRGLWQGRRVLSEEWVNLASSAHSDNSSGGSPDWKAGYGFQFWRNSRHGYRGDGAYGQLCIIVPEWELTLAITAECSDMNAEMNAVWTFLDAYLQGAQEDGPGLLQAYQPKGKLDGTLRDTGWQSLKSNSFNAGAVRVQTDARQARVSFLGEEGVQSIVAPCDAWQEGYLFGPDLLVSMMWGHPLFERRKPLHYAASSRWEENALYVECRMLDSPHTFELRVTLDDGVKVTLFSPRGVFDASLTLMT